MPKLKTRRSVAKRVHFTSKGKVRRAQANKSHLRTHRSSKRKRQLGKGDLVSKADQKQFKRLLPWG